MTFVSSVISANKSSDFNNPEFSPSLPFVDDGGKMFGGLVSCVLCVALRAEAEQNSFSSESSSLLLSQLTCHNAWLRRIQRRVTVQK